MVLPAPIAVPWEEYQREAWLFQKVHRLVDTYEALLKYATAIAVQNFYAAGLAAAFPEVDGPIRGPAGRRSGAGQGFSARCWDVSRSVRAISFRASSRGFTSRSLASSCGCSWSTGVG
jgi:hypothetical protein